MGNENFYPHTASVENIRNMIRNFIAHYNEAKDTVKSCEDAIQDILHDLELREYTYHEYAKFGKEITNLRRERRKAKDTIENLQAFFDWAEANKTIIWNNLGQALGEMRKVDARHANRIYTRRADPVGTHIISNVKC